MKAFLKNNWFVFFPYLLLIIVSAFYLLQYSKVPIHSFMNKMTGNPVADTFFKYITHAGDGIVAALIIAIVLLLNARNGVILLFSYASSGIVTTIIKKLSPDAYRPHFIFHEVLFRDLNYIEGVEMLGMRSFPSGHSTTAFAVFMTLAFTTTNKTLKFTFFLIAVLSAFSRTYLSQHWLVDITVGSLIGSIAAVLFYFIFISQDRLQNLNRPLLNVFNR